MNDYPRPRTADTRGPDAPLRTNSYAVAEMLLDLMEACPPEHPTDEYLRMKARCEELLGQENDSKGAK